MSLLNVGSRALLANQAALQTAGHNIANVSTPGYSRQTVVLQTVQGQFTGGGYIGKGVDVQTIQRNHSELLTRQSTAASAVDAGDLEQTEADPAGNRARIFGAVSQILDRGGDCLLAVKETQKLWPTPCGNSSPMGTSPALVVCQSAPTRPLRKIMAASKPAKPCGLPTCLGWIRNSGHIGQNLPGSA